MPISLATAGGPLFAEGFVGMVADGTPSQIASRTNTNATSIELGVVVANDPASANGCRPWAADTDLIEGISVREVLFPADSSGNVKYAQYSSVPVMKDGVITVQAAEAVRKGDQVLILLAGGAGNTTPGALGGSKGGVAGTGRIDYPGAIWEEDAASGAIGRIRVKYTGTRRTTT